MRGQRCPLCGEVTAEFNKRLGCWACRCGWTDRRPATSPAPRRLVFEGREEDDTWSGMYDATLGQQEGVASPLRIRQPGT